MIVRVPDGDLGEARDPAVADGQIVGGQASDQAADGRPTAAQVPSRVGLDHGGGRGGVFRVEIIDELAGVTKAINRSRAASMSAA